MNLPSATYRLQLRDGMTFARAAALGPYLADLGISHVYLSPIFEAVPGSTHGYDVIDNTTIAGELGGETGFTTMAAELARHGLRLLLDFVPNHMAANPRNPWWFDVLEWGAESRYARHFDIDWSAPKLILPVLADSYGKILQQGELGLAFDAAAGAISLNYGDLALPLTPSSYTDVLRHTSDQVLIGLAERFSEATPDTAARLKREFAAAGKDPAVAGSLQRALETTKANASALHALHERQVWRLTHWRAAREMLTHRRFFEITDLVGLRVELPDVFADVHAHVVKLAKDGSIDGLRLDHIDGLADPKGYLDRLQEAIGGTRPFYLLVEKILGPDEVVRKDWPVAGTTGYEFIGSLAGLLVDARGEVGMTAGYRRFVGESADYHDLVTRTKRRTLTHNFAGELHTLTQMALRIAARHLATRDLGADTLRAAIVELASALPVYRTYVTAEGANNSDRSILDKAAQQAAHTRKVEAVDAIELVKRLALADTSDSADRPIALQFATRFQQTSGALTAKAVEDTAFYRYTRLLALNEVGGEPDEFGAPPETFHRAMAQRLERQPFGLSTTATHDTKRGEDARARLYALSEMPDAWAAAVERWRHLNHPIKSDVRGRPAPDAAAEWTFYQALAGAWPPALKPRDASGLAGLADRMKQFALKAAREAKLHTSWTSPDPDYEQALERFVLRALDPQASREFLADFCSVLQPITVAGVLNSLSQTLIKVAAPCVPDIYQGTELWDFSLVDPDNRRPVDFDEISRLAADLDQRRVESLAQDWRSGAIKLHVLRTALRLRMQMPALFRTGRYVPLEIVGDLREHVDATAEIALSAVLESFPVALMLGTGEGSA